MGFFVHAVLYLLLNLAHNLDQSCYVCSDPQDSRERFNRRCSFTFFTKYNKIFLKKSCKKKLRHVSFLQNDIKRWSRLLAIWQVTWRATGDTNTSNYVRRATNKLKWQVNTAQHTPSPCKVSNVSWNLFTLKFDHNNWVGKKCKFTNVIDLFFEALAFRLTLF